jgi:hypothetical protein
VASATNCHITHESANCILILCRRAGSISELSTVAKPHCCIGQSILFKSAGSVAALQVLLYSHTLKPVEDAHEDDFSWEPAKEICEMVTDNMPRPSAIVER